MSGGVFVITPGIQAAWTNLAKMLEPSTGTFSGPPNNQNTPSGNKQWLRRFNLTVYKAGQPSTAAPGPVTQGAIGPGANILRFRRAPFDETSTTLPEVAVTAPAVPAASPPQTSLDGIDLSNLRCRFNLQSSVGASPNAIVIRVYNMAPDTMKKVVAMTRVVVSAGYVYGLFGVIFDGLIYQYLRGKESPVDTYLDIFAGDGDAASNGSSVFMTFPAGTSEEAKMQAYIKAEKENQQDLKTGATDDRMASEKTIREHVVAGDTKNQRRELALKWNQNHFYDNGEINVLRRDKYKDGEAVVLDPTTGLIGLPEATPQGIQARCLINPKLKLGGLVKITTDALSGVAYIPGTTTPIQSVGQGAQITGLAGQAGLTNFQPPVPTSPTGTYKICWMNITGDTRGDQWFDDMTCVGLNSNNVVLASPGSAWAHPGKGANTGIGSTAGAPATNTGG